MKNISNSLNVLALLFLFNFSYGQQTGNINFEQLGISFTIPNGWVGQEGEGIYMMGSNTIPGLVLLMPQDYVNIQTMRQELSKGYADAMGTNLKLAGSISSLDQRTLGAEYIGTLEGQAVKAYVVGVLNTYGQEVLIMAVTTTNLYSAEQKKVALAVKNSLVFKQPKVFNPGNDWKQLLSGVRLTYMDSYYSSSYTDGGISGGYSTELKFDLCSAGYFNYYGSDNMSAGGNFSSAYSAGNSQGSGTWEVTNQSNGTGLLRLKFNNGKVWEYTVEMKEKKLYLNNKRFYRTWTGDYAPNCK